MAQVTPPVWWKTALDWVAVWLIVWITAAFATFLVDPAPIESLLEGTLLARSALIATFVTAFYGAVTWLRRDQVSVPKDILDKLPQDPPTGPAP